MERPYILHMFTPGAQASPFDVNMAADAGYGVIVPYCNVVLDQVAGLTQDAIFSRGPKGVARTGIFVGGRDVMLAADMLDRARKAMVPPFVVSVFADPSGSYTTAAGLVAYTEAALREHHATTLEGKRVLLLGGTGTVGRIAAVLCGQLGAHAVLASHRDKATAQKAADETARRFGGSYGAASSHDAADLQAELALADVVMGVAAAGVQVMSADARAHAKKLLVAADVNAVPPEGLAGVGVFDAGKRIEGMAHTGAVGIGALAIGDVKYQTQHRLLERMCSADEPVAYSFADALVVAREVMAEKAAKAAQKAADKAAGKS